MLRALRAEDTRLGEDLLGVEVPGESGGLRLDDITREDISKRKKMRCYCSALTFYNPPIWAFRCILARHVLQGPALLPRSPSACCGAYLRGVPGGAGRQTSRRDHLRRLRRALPQQKKLKLACGQSLCFRSFDGAFNKGLMHLTLWCRALKDSVIAYACVYVCVCMCTSVQSGQVCVCMSVCACLCGFFCV